MRPDCADCLAYLVLTGLAQAIHEYQVVGRHKPTETDPKPSLYRMRIFAPNEVVAKSRYWYFLSKYHKMKKTTGEILAVNEIHDRKPDLVKNYAIFVRYDSRSGTHNLYKEFRDTTRCGAVAQMCAYCLPPSRAAACSRPVRHAVACASWTPRRCVLAPASC